MSHMVGVSYMGTKRQLADTVGKLADTSSQGPFLDVFAGMCSVGSAISTKRQIWSNDLQFFANAVATAYFCSKEGRPDNLLLSEICFSLYAHHKKFLIRKFFNAINREERALHDGDVDELGELFYDSISVSNRLYTNSSFTSYDLFVRRFGSTYFSTIQSIELDCIRFSLDKLLQTNSISAETHRWGVIALCIAMSKSTTTTGHFAQPLAPKSTNITRFKNQRLRSIWHEWTKALAIVDPIGSSVWRKKNRAYRAEALQLLETLSVQKIKPRLIYADPPYTKDQYSRYYHLYETAILYDYPVAIGMGLYRGNRESSQFSQITKVEKAIEELIRISANLRSDLIMSYPTNGLLADSHRKIPELFARFYRKKVDIYEIAHSHSTMGGSKGPVRSNVTEIIYSVRVE